MDNESVSRYDKEVIKYGFCACWNSFCELKGWMNKDKQSRSVTSRLKKVFHVRHCASLLESSPPGSTRQRVFLCIVAFLKEKKNLVVIKLFWQTCWHGAHSACESFPYWSFWLGEFPAGGVRINTRMDTFLQASMHNTADDNFALVLYLEVIRSKFRSSFWSLWI